MKQTFSNTYSLEKTLKKVVTDISETEELAGIFAEMIQSGESVSLEGDLGAGKTTFIRFFLRALGYEGVVRSPSFTLVNIYPHNPRVVHVDLFRLSDPGELIALNLEEEKEDSILLVEWGDRLIEEWGPPDWLIRIKRDEDIFDKRYFEIYGKV